MTWARLRRETDSERAVLLDGCLQVAGAALMQRFGGAIQLQAIERIDVICEFPSSVWVIAQPETDEGCVSVWVLDETRTKTVAIFHSIRFASQESLLGASDVPRGPAPPDLMEIPDIEGRCDAIEKFLSLLIGHWVDGSSAEKIDRSTPIAGLGVDSLMAVKLRHYLQTSLQVWIPLSAFLGEASVAVLTGEILRAIEDSASEDAEEEEEWVEGEL